MKRHQPKSNDLLSSLAALWLAESNLLATIDALQAEADRIASVAEVMNTHGYTHIEIEDAAAAISKGESETSPLHQYGLSLDR